MWRGFLRRLGRQTQLGLGGALAATAASELSRDFGRIVQSWDTANKATASTPTLALPRMRGGKGGGARPGAFKVKDLYLIDLLRQRMEYPELKRELHAQYDRFRPGVVLIENKASGT
jgi:phage terminase large subunit-like protein